ncbi:MAG: hypothetical protein ABDH21_01215 [bacterium]
MREMVRFILAIFIIMCTITPIFAQDYFRYNTVNIRNNKYSFNISLWNTKLTGELFASSNSFTTSLQDDLGFARYKGSILIDFNYNLSNINSVGFSMFFTSHRAVRTLTRDITLPATPNDVSISSGTTVSSSVRYSSIDIFYRQYLTREERYEFYGTTGFRLNNMKGTFCGSNVGAGVDFDTPFMFLGLGGSFLLSDNFRTNYNLKGLSISMGGERISFIEYQLDIEYGITSNWGVTIGYKYNNTKFNDDLGKYMKYRYEGMVFGVSGRF